MTKVTKKISDSGITLEHDGDELMMIEISGSMMLPDQSSYLSAEQVVELKTFCESFLTAVKQAPGRKKAEEEGVEFCVSCNGPCQRKNVCYDEDEEA
jgi:hypothetical protein